jgi:hypothetical protein
LAMSYIYDTRQVTHSQVLHIRHPPGYSWPSPTYTTPARLLIAKSGKRLFGDSGYNYTHKGKVPLSLEELIVSNGQSIRDDDRKIA